MDPAFEELERRSRYLSSLIRRTKLSAVPAPSQPEPEPGVTQPTPEPEPESAVEKRGEAKAEPVVDEEEKREAKQAGDGKGKEIKGKDDGGPKEDNRRKVSVRVRAADMPLPLQRRAVRLAYEAIAAMPRLDSKRLALALKKEFDTAYGPAWHCIVGTSFGSYVTHSLGGFLYFSVDKAYILLFRTAVEPLVRPR
uniref:Microtubule motor n=1 Tax=Zea mays TaxID=4577 RepID=B6TQL2_MAIZE|nr:microtubule motor [Zea mays]|eukprot:NP_001150520.1 microtubule motor [Zea mays]